MLEQWSSSLTATSSWFWEVLDGTGRSSPNLTYTCMVGIIPRLQYIAWENVLKKGWEKKSSNFYDKTVNSCKTLLINKTI